MSAVGIAEVTAYLRIANADEDAAIAALVRVATEMCETYIGGPLIDRETSAVVAATGRWQLLPEAPVSQIFALQWIGADGTLTDVDLLEQGIDIDANGDGIVRITGPKSLTRVRVSYRAGLAPDWNGVPEAVRQGLIRLTAHLFVAREAPVSTIPAAVVALWRPWRKMRLT